MILANFYKARLSLEIVVAALKPLLCKSSKQILIFLDPVHFNYEPVTDSLKTQGRQTLSNFIWEIVKIMVPFGAPIILRGLIRGLI